MKINTRVNIAITALMLLLFLPALAEQPSVKAHKYDLQKLSPQPEPPDMPPLRVRPRTGKTVQPTGNIKPGMQRKGSGDPRAFPMPEGGGGTGNTKEIQRYTPPVHVRKAATIMQLNSDKGKLFLEIKPAPKKIIFYSGKRKLGSLMGKNRTRFDITTYAMKAKKGQLQVITYDDERKQTTRTFNVSSYLKNTASSKTKTTSRSKQQPFRTLPKMKEKQKGKTSKGSSHYGIIKPAYKVKSTDTKFSTSSKSKKEYIKRSQTKNRPSVSAYKYQRKPMAISPGVTPSSAASIRPTVDIRSFVVRKHRDNAVMARQGYEPDGEISIRIGQSVVMTWNIRVCRANRVNITIGGGIGIVPPGTQSESDSGCSTWQGSKTVTPNRNTIFILEVSVVSTSRMGAVDTAAVRVNVAAPVVELVTPEVNDRERTIIFYAANRGALDYDAQDVAITGRYSVTNWNRTITYASGDIEARNVPIGAGEQIEIGSVTLPTSPNPYAAETIHINLEVSDRAGFIADTSGQLNHAHRWRMELKPISSRLLLSIVESQITGEIRLNNYQSPGRDTLADTNPPSIMNDSHVTIVDQTREFTIPWDTYNLKSNGNVIYRFVPFVNDINATVGGRRTGFIKHGVIGTRITFEVGGGNEIVGWKRENRTLLDSAPDINITKLEFDISANLSARNGRIQVKSVYISKPKMEFRITGHALAGIMNAFKSYFDTKVSGIVRSQVNAMLTSANIKTTMETLINQELQNFGTGYIYRMTLDPADGMTIIHIP